jgi:hypothetical protein
MVDYSKAASDLYKDYTKGMSAADLFRGLQANFLGDEIRRAHAIAIQLGYDPNGVNQGPMDAFRHTWTGAHYAANGQWGALKGLVGGTLNELNLGSIHRNLPPDSTMDMANNAIGAAVGTTARSVALNLGLDDHALKAFSDAFNAWAVDYLTRNSLNFTSPEAANISTLERWTKHIKPAADAIKARQYEFAGRAFGLSESYKYRTLNDLVAAINGKYGSTPLGAITGPLPPTDGIDRAGN